MVVVWNVLLAPITLGEQLTPTRKIGAFLICAGTVCVGLFGNHTEVDRTVSEYLELFARPASLVYYFFFGIWSIVCWYYYKRGSPYVSGKPLPKFRCVSFVCSVFPPLTPALCTLYFIPYTLYRILQSIWHPTFVLYTLYYKASATRTFV